MEKCSEGIFVVILYPN